MKRKYVSKGTLIKLFSIIKMNTNKIFIGTRTTWDSLSVAEKNKYDIAKIVED